MKWPWGKDWGELLKDFSALFNSYISPEEKEHKKYLIIGVDEVNKKYQDFDVNSRKEKISDLEDLEKLKGTSINCHLAAFKRLEPLRSRCHSQKNLYFSRCP